MKKSTLPRLALLLLFSYVPFVTYVHAEDTSATPTCTRASLQKYREDVFNRQMEEKKYAEAANGLEEYLEKGDCWTALVKTIGSASPENRPQHAEEFIDAEQYLWARSDLALAYLKNDEPGKCLTLVQTEMNQYYTNPLKTVDSEPITKAFSTNETLCLARRKELFPEFKSDACDLSALPKDLAYSRTSNKSKAVRVTLKKVESSLKLPSTTGFDCVAVVEVSMMRGVLNELCDTVKACQEDEDPEISANVTVAELLGITFGKKFQVTWLDYANDTGWCGEPTISLHSEASKGSQGAPNILHVSSGLSPCEMGTGRADVDSYFLLENGKFLPRDLSMPTFH